MDSGSDLGSTGIIRKKKPFWEQEATFSDEASWPHLVPIIMMNTLYRLLLKGCFHSVLMTTLLHFIYEQTSMKLGCWSGASADVKLTLWEAVHVGTTGSESGK